MKGGSIRSGDWHRLAPHLERLQEPRNRLYNGHRTKFSLLGPNAIHGVTATQALCSSFLADCVPDLSSGVGIQKYTLAGGKTTAIPFLAI